MEVGLIKKLSWFSFLGFWVPPIKVGLYSGHLWDRSRIVTEFYMNIEIALNVGYWSWWAEFCQKFTAIELFKAWFSITFSRVWWSGVIEKVFQKSLRSYWKRVDQGLRRLDVSMSHQHSVKSEIDLCQASFHPRPLVNFSTRQNVTSTAALYLRHWCNHTNM